MNYIYKISICILSLLLLGGCGEEFLDLKPIGSVNEVVLQTEEGTQALLIAAYSMLDGYSQGDPLGGGQNGEASGTNWIWGDVASDDMYRGDQTGGWSEINEIERYEVTSTNAWLNRAWIRYFDAVSRCNDVLKILAQAEGNINADVARQTEAEARWLRAWYHFQLRIKFEKVPYITQDVDPVTVSNDREIWDDIEADIQWGIDNNMEETPTDLGRVSRWAAKAFKARVHLFQQEYTEAKPYLQDILDNGPFELMEHFYDNHNEEFQNNKESILDIQYSVNDGAGVHNSGLDHQTLFTRKLGFCCDYSAPSFDLFNAFKVDENGLPFLDSFQDNLLTEDHNILFDEEFTPTDQMMDPRVDWTIGRRGIPFLDWGPFTGSDWMLDQAGMGPFLNKKIHFFQRNEDEIKTSDWWWAGGLNGDNFNLFRLSHIMLWRAEVAVEENDLETARILVNQIRERASDDLVMGKIANTNFAAGFELDIDETQPAANYNLGLYESFPSQEYARKAVRHEIRLEFALEGMRFFDLVRWGIDAQTLGAYLARENGLRPWMTGAQYDGGKDDHWPIPQIQLDLQSGVLIQDPAHN
ncbi:MAG: RagB/SusD family nutrient uptake outer membrane protein [Bacteroidota bacterium]